MSRPLRLPTLVLTALMLSLPSCAPVPPASPPVAVVAPARDFTPDDRRAEIRRQLRAICPQPMTSGDLTRAADALEAHPDILWMVRRLDLFDRQSRICRGGSS